MVKNISTTYIYIYITIYIYRVYIYMKTYENSLSLILTCHPNRWWSWGDSVTLRFFFSGEDPNFPRVSWLHHIESSVKNLMFDQWPCNRNRFIAATIYTIYKAYLWGLNFREYRQNSAWKIWYSLTYLHGILKFPSGWCFGTWIYFSIIYIYGNNHHLNWLSLHHFSEG